MDAGGSSTSWSRSAGVGSIDGKILAAGLNAHNQIQDNGGKDIRSFAPIFDSSAGAGVGRVLFACWSSTIIVSGSRINGTGFQKLSQSLPSGVAETLIDGFGDHNGMKGCLDTTGNLYLISGAGELDKRSTESSPKIGHIALAGNGKLALSFKQAPNGRLCHILQFDTFDQFKTWFHDPSGVQIEPEKQHFMMQGRPLQVVANIGTFAVLMEGGEVYTWGDPRYQSLGRSIKDAPAHKPGLLESLGGLRIVKLAAGGWMNAVLAEDRVAYVWGAGLPGTEKTLKMLRDAGAGEVSLISIPSAGNSDAEPLDIVDIGVGDNHLAFLAEGGQLFVAGDNQNGQLGMNCDEPWFDDWTKVPMSDSTGKVRGLLSGPKATFMYVDSQSEPS